MAMAIPQIGTALIDARADAVTFFSNAWNDNVSFLYPHDPSSRDAANTWYRLAVLAGKERPFPQPTVGSEAADFGSDGGSRNFMRMLESCVDGVRLDGAG
jgi:hypothetical protein